MKKLFSTLFMFSLLGLVGWTPFSFLLAGSVTAEQGTPDWMNQEMRSIEAQADNIDQNVLKLSLLAYNHARERGIDSKGLLTIIDFSKPSTERRLWVVDLIKSRVLFNTWVSHGKNSGQLMATSFSNQPGSLKSSIGVFVTEEPYTGGLGYALRIRGLERGINDNAYRRSIVVHGAWYADPSIITQYGEIGRSWGCPAVKPDLVRPIVNTIKDNTLIVAYYPDQNWLSHSRFLAG